MITRYIIFNSGQNQSRGYLRLSPQTIPLHYSITYKSECATFMCIWYVGVILLLFLFCHYMLFLYFFTLVSYSSLWGKESILLIIDYGIRPFPSLCAPANAPSRKQADSFCWAWLDSYASSYSSTTHF